MTMARKDAQTHGATAAFTFLESLIALAVIALVAGVLIHSHFIAVRAGKSARILDNIRWSGEEVLTRQLLQMPADNSATDSAPFTVTAEPALAPGNGAGAPVWMKWSVTPTNAPGLKAEFYLQRR